MGRPTEELKDRTVKLRLSKELYEEVEKNGVNMSESIRNLIRVGLKKHGKIQSGGNVPQNEEEGLKAALLLRCTDKSRKIFEESGWSEIRVVTNEEYAERGKNVPQNLLEIGEEKYSDLENMCRVSGMSVGRFMEYVYRLFSEGKIYIDGYVVKTKGECDVSELEEVCHRINVDPQEMIDKLAKGLLRG